MGSEFLVTLSLTLKGQTQGHQELATHYFVIFRSHQISVNILLKLINGVMQGRDILERRKIAPLGKPVTYSQLVSKCKLYNVLINYDERRVLIKTDIYGLGVA